MPEISPAQRSAVQEPEDQRNPVPERDYATM